MARELNLVETLERRVEGSPPVGGGDGDIYRR
jgi:hypothetical protein